MNNTWKNFKNRAQEKGTVWALRFIFLTLPGRILDELIIFRKKDMLLSEDETHLVDLPSHSIESNRRLWNGWDWSDGGEEWTSDSLSSKGLDPVRWKTTLINEMLKKYIKTDSNTLEIGPGGGRWTDELQRLVKHLIIADISKKCLDICKERFKLKNNIEYKLIKTRLDFIHNNTIDFVWSYDVFVHINPSDVERYIEDIERVLKPGGYAVIHHAGNYSLYTRKQESWRAYLGKKQFANLVAKHGMNVLEQNESLVHLPGDVITVFAKQPN